MTPTQTSIHRRPPALLIIAGWLVPALGLLLLGERYRRRAFLFMGIVYSTFLIGLLLGGGVVPPILQGGGFGTSIVALLTFLIQAFAGWPALLSLAAHQIGIPFLAANEPGAYYELGSFYCLAAGAMNYFIVCQSLDRNRIEAFEN